MDTQAHIPAYRGGPPPAPRDKAPWHGAQQRVRPRRAAPRSRRWLVAGGFCCILLLAPLLPDTSWADDQANAAAIPAARAAFPAPSTQARINDTPAVPRWTVAIEGIMLGRLGGPNRALTARVPGNVPFLATAITPGTGVFNASQFQQAPSAGPKLNMAYRSESGYGIELGFFHVFNQSAVRSIGAGNPADWLIMRAPGGFWQTQDFPYQAMTWNAATTLYSAEANARFDLLHRLTVFAGFRWLRLNDNLQGTLTPADSTAPSWKTACPLCNLFQVTPGGPIGTLPPFWNTGTSNNLYGVQLGADGTMLELGRLSLHGRIAAGVFDNAATQSTGVSIRKIVYPSATAASGVAFASEAGLQVQYRVMDGLSLKAGYEVLWLDGIALAPRQIDETYAAPSMVHAFGIEHASSVLFQGGTFGLAYSF